MHTRFYKVSDHGQYQYCGSGFKATETKVAYKEGLEITMVEIGVLASKATITVLKEITKKIIKQKNESSRKNELDQLILGAQQGAGWPQSLTTLFDVQAGISDKLSTTIKEALKKPRFKAIITDIYETIILACEEEQITQYQTILKNAVLAEIDVQELNQNEETLQSLCDLYARAVIQQVQATIKKIRQSDAPLYLEIQSNLRLAQSIDISRKALDRLQYFDSAERIRQHTVAIETWKQKYKTALKTEYSKIQLPDLDRDWRIAFDRLYVAPRFKLNTPMEAIQGPISADALFLNLERTVVLGDPGAGKSTFGIYVVNKVLAERGNRIPIIVTLRDYAIRGLGTGKSINQYIETQFTSKFQNQCPDGGLETLLMDGEVVIIFDGLDELLDISNRRDIRQRIETFSALHPRCEILTTSRQVGYDSAALDPDIFTSYIIDRFSASEVRNYVTKWFTVHGNNRDISAQEKSIDFMHQSEEVKDLRANPLMLSLMCIIFKGDQYIPRNRPDVFARCANLLFEKWDKHRNINVELAIGQDDLWVALQHIAYWIYSQDTADSQVTRDQLISEVERCLEDRYVESSSERRNAAEEFVDFCAGRAWVITEAGHNEHDESVFKFTHRTFLEYFAAFHVCRINDSPEDVAKFLISRIAKSQWDMLAQLAVQIKEKGNDKGSQRVLERLLDDKRRRSVASQSQIFSFVARCLKFANVSETFLRRFTQIVVDFSLPAFQVRDVTRSGQLQVLHPFTELLENSDTKKHYLAKHVCAYLKYVIQEGDDERREHAIAMILSIEALSARDLYNNLVFLYSETAAVWTAAAKDVRQEFQKDFRNCLSQYAELYFLSYASNAADRRNWIAFLEADHSNLALFFLPGSWEDGFNPRWIYRSQGFYGTLLSHNSAEERSVMRPAAIVDILNVIRNSIRSGGIPVPESIDRWVYRWGFQFFFDHGVSDKFSGDEEVNALYVMRCLEFMMLAECAFHFDLVGKQAQDRSAQIGLDLSAMHKVIREMEKKVVSYESGSYWKTVMTSWRAGNLKFLKF